ncbi:bifunctional 4-hydroxy-2-oxoglutarate aldolase/2-dehydro-3-deoxy-phosphogluconate aldolase [Yunchengibacter salinarum]|uniref:bifunctional 4-hydroxy-2-oxoglutarate aldolase/2-dehydro-3-deoxy-phosphogluconate aldolase n=1 Tax=Yunchengibacter salinarum TaxID=3133399 RepID=UPI0035B62FED
MTLESIPLDTVFAKGPVIPVLNFTGPEEAVATCTTLFENGVSVLEITLRHDSALDSIEAVSKALPDAIVGAGTVLSHGQAEKARAAGAGFGVSPGLTDELALAVESMGWAFLPGVATVSEAMKAREKGFSHLKFFPAADSGGPGFLKAAGSVLPDVRFCPTGGIKPGNAADYLALGNVAVVGGSWLVKRDGAGKVDQKATAQAAKEAAALSA